MSSPPAASAPPSAREHEPTAAPPQSAAEQAQQQQQQSPSHNTAATAATASMDDSSASDNSTGADSSRESSAITADDSNAAAAAASSLPAPSRSPSASPPSRSPSSGGLSSSPSPSPSPRAFPFPSRRCRVYHLRGSDGQWLDWGVGWCIIGNEIPLGDPTLKQKHIIVKAEKRKGHGEATELMEADHAPTSSLGLPSLLQPTLLSLHVPSAKHWGEQNSTIITLTTQADSHHAAQSRRLHQQHQIAAAQGTAAATATADGDAPPPSLPIEEGDEIDIALSFAEPAHAAELWKYVMSFVEVQQQQQEEEEQAARDAAAEEAAEAAAAQAETSATVEMADDTNNGAAAMDDESPAVDAEEAEDAAVAAPLWSAAADEQDDDLDVAVSPPVPELIGQSLGGGGLTLSNRNGAWVASEARTSIKDDDDDDEIDALADGPASTRFYSHSRRAPPQPSRSASASSVAPSSGRTATAAQRASLVADDDDDDAADDSAGAFLRSLVPQGAVGRRSTVLGSSPTSTSTVTNSLSQFFAGLDDDDEEDEAAMERDAGDGFVSAHLKNLLTQGAAGSKQHAAAQRAGKTVGPSLQSHGQRLAAAAASASNRSAARRGATSGALSGSDDERDAPSAVPAAPVDAEEDAIFPQSLHVPTLSNLPRLHEHVANLLSPPSTPPDTPSPSAASAPTSSGAGAWGSSFGASFRRGVAAGSTKRAQQLNYSPLKKRQIFVSEITRKSSAYNKSLMNGLAKRAAVKAPITAPQSADGAAPPATTASVGSPSLSASAPVSPGDLNFLENLSALLGEIDREVELRMTRGDMAEPASNSPKATAPVDTAAAAPAPDTPMSNGNSDAPAPAPAEASPSVPSMSVSPSVSSAPLAAVTPSNAPLSLLLSSASLIQGVVTMLLAFSSQPLLVSLFDYASAHCMRYQMFLVITAFEYEAAEARFAKHAASSVVAGSSPVPSADSGASSYASLFRRHRGYLQSVLFKSPFPLSMTHAIDVPIFAQTAAQPTNPEDAASLSAPPTRFCLHLVASYLSQYCRDTFLYSPRQLDDPLLLMMNQQVVNKINHAIMQMMLTDGEATALASGGWMGAAQSRKPKRKVTGPPKAKWTAHIFGQIRHAISEFEQQQRAESPVHAPVASPDLSSAAAPAASPVPAAVYSLVSSLSRDWCDLLPLGFCTTLSDYLYALHSLFALAKNSSNQNGVLPQQKHEFFRKLLSEGVVDCLELVMHFCQRQQQRTSDDGDAIVGAAVGPPPALSINLSAPATLSWLRVLCVDMLCSLQAACPGFLRSFLDQRYLHAAKFAAPMPEPFVNSNLRGRGKRAKKVTRHTTNQSTHTHETSRQPAQSQLSSCARPVCVQSDAVAKREWEESVDQMHAHMAQITPESCEHSLLVLLFNLITDKSCYVGIRHSASSFLRLALDPEQGRSPSEHAPRRLLGGFESTGDGAPNANPLVYLLALGGVGSSAPKQMQIDSDSEQDAEVEEESEAAWTANGARLSAAALQAHAKQKRKAEEEAARRRMLLKQQRIEKQRMVGSDPLIHFIYQHPRAMPAVVRCIKGACAAWTAVVSSPSSNHAQQLSAFLRAYPATLLTDVLDFVSFFSLRHSEVFRRFALASHLIEAIAELFPQPVLSEQEEAQRKEREHAQQASKQSSQPMPQPNGDAVLTAASMDSASMVDAAAAALPVASGSSVALVSASPSPSPDLTVVAHSHSPSPSPAPAPPASSAASVPPAAAGFRAPVSPMLPTPILCAAMRFVRICAEVDEAFHAPILHSSFLLRLLELFLSNLRPNLLHSSILELFTFVDSSAILPLCGQMIHGNLYTAQLRQAAMRRVHRYHHAKTQRDLRALLRKAVPGATPHQTDDAVKQIHRVMEQSKLEGRDPNAAGSNEATRIIETLKATLMGATPAQAAAAADKATTAVTLPAPSPSPSPEAPSPLHASLADSDDVAPLPYLSAAYGVARVQHLPAWPTRRFKFIRIRAAKRDAHKANSALATKPTSALTGHKRGRDEDEDEGDDDLPPAAPSFGGLAPAVAASADDGDHDGAESPDESPEDRIRHKKLKLKSTIAAAARYSGTDAVEPASSRPPSSSAAAAASAVDSSSDASSSSDSDGLSVSSVDVDEFGSESSDSPPPPARSSGGRAGSRSIFGFEPEDDDDDDNAIMAAGSDEDDDDDNGHTRARRQRVGGGGKSRGKGAWPSGASPSLSSAADDDDDNFFAHWPDEEDDAHNQEEKIGQQDTQQHAQPHDADAASAHAAAHEAHAAAIQHFAQYADDAEEQPFSATALSSPPPPVVSPPPSLAAAGSSASASASASASSVSALDARLAAFQSAQRVARESAQQEEHKNDAFQRLANKTRDKIEGSTRAAAASVASASASASAPSLLSPPPPSAPRPQGIIAFSFGAPRQKQTPAAKTMALFATNTQPTPVPVSATAITADTGLADDSNAHEQQQQQQDK